MNEHVHVPVMLDRVVALLAPALAADPVQSGPGGTHSVVVDATLGLGGHAEEILRRFADVQLIGVDRDPHALAASTDRLAPYGDRLTLVHAVYDELPAVLDRMGLRRVQGVLFDLGVSSLQLDDEGRGFSYRRDVPLDMRMDPSSSLTAADVLNSYPADDLARVLREYGEERFARRIATAVVRQRARAPFTSSARLVELVRDAIPAAARRTGGNPAKRTFQALRIEVNGELDSLARALPAAIAALAVGGRIVVLSYHSLEDRLVKRIFAAGASSDVPADLPVVPPGREPQLRLLTRGAETPDPSEIAANPRAASVRLRAAARVLAAA
jgi:16S rRNA (cytosine1402-N4)-methyltransferase